ncbi:MAG: class I SAM-dependent methyltransferase [Maribacter sp.]|nr:class I SAM-dependent methyltransferase [Maribacter sp.]
MKVYLKTKDYAFSGEEFELLCDEGLQMLITKPVPGNLDAYYQSDSYISHSDARKTIGEKLYQTVKKFNLYKKVRIINTFANDNRTLLDVGAGTGDFLVAAKKQGWHITGIEPNQVARARAANKNVSLVSSFDFLKNDKFQVITLWHVLEHVPDLELQIARLIRHLEPDGTLVIAVPNYKSFDASYYKKYWAAYDVPRHLWHFSKASIKLLFSNHAMTVVKVLPLIFDAYYVALLSEQYKSGKQNFLKAFLIGARSNLAAWRSKEYSSLIYILKRNQNHF